MWPAMPLPVPRCSAKMPRCTRLSRPLHTGAEKSRPCIGIGPGRPRQSASTSCLSAERATSLGFLPSSLKATPEPAPRWRSSSGVQALAGSVRPAAYAHGHGHGHGLTDEADLKEVNTEIMLRIQESGIAILSDTTVAGRHCLRVAINNHRTTQQDWSLLISVVLQTGESVASGLAQPKQPRRP